MPTSNPCFSQKNGMDFSNALEMMQVAYWMEKMLEEGLRCMAQKVLLLQTHLLSRQSPSRMEKLIMVEEFILEIKPQLTFTSVFFSNAGPQMIIALEEGGQYILFKVL